MGVLCTLLPKNPFSRLRQIWEGHLKTRIMLPALVFIDSNEILLLESYPVQVHMIIAGNLPTPCNELRLIVSPPDDNNRIEIEAYSVTEPNLMCTQVLEPFEARISLGNFTEGEFTVWIEGEQVGEFSLP
jgi:hypothetical protein